MILSFFHNMNTSRKLWMVKKFQALTDVLYIFASFLLVGIALFLMGSSLLELVTLEKDLLTIATLNATSMIIISIAIFDVGKYLIEEEVSRDQEIRDPHEARKTLTKFVVITIIAINMESLVSVFLAGKTDISLLMYPSLLLVASAVLMASLGLYQKMSVSSERTIIENEKKEKK